MRFKPVEKALIAMGLLWLVFHKSKDARKSGQYGGTLNTDKGYSDLSDRIALGTPTWPNTTSNQALEIEAKKNKGPANWQALGWSSPCGPTDDAWGQFCPDSYGDGSGPLDPNITFTADP